MLVGGAGDAADFSFLVQSPEFGGLRQGDDLWPRIVHIGAAGNDFEDPGGGQLAMAMGRQKELRAIEEKLRRSAFIGFHVGRVTADHRLIRLAKRRQRNRIGGGAVENKENLGVRFKDFPQAIANVVRCIVVAVRRSKPIIGVDERRHGFGTNARRIVAGKLQVKARSERGVVDCFHGPVFE